RLSEWRVHGTPAASPASGRGPHARRRFGFIGSDNDWLSESEQLSKLIGLRLGYRRADQAHAARAGAGGDNEIGSDQERCFIIDSGQEWAEIITELFDLREI